MLFKSAGTGQITLGKKRRGQVSHQGQGVGVLVAQHAAAHGQCLLFKSAGTGQITLGVKRSGQVVHRGQGVGVFVAQHAAAHGQHLPLESAGAGQITLGEKRPGQVVHRAQGVAMLVAEVVAVDRERALEDAARRGIDAEAVLKIAAAAVQQQAEAAAVDRDVRTQRVELQHVRQEDRVARPVLRELGLRRQCAVEQRQQHARVGRRVGAQAMTRHLLRQTMELKRRRVWPGCSARRDVRRRKVEAFDQPVAAQCRDRLLPGERLAHGAGKSVGQAALRLLAEQEFRHRFGRAEREQTQ